MTSLSIELRTILARAILALALMVVLPSSVFARDRGAPDLRVMTYNIRLDLASDGKNAWPQRRDMVAALIAREAPDLLGMQEVLIGQKQDLERALPEFRMIGVARDDGREKGEFSPIAYRHERFTVIEAGTIWLSETPTTPSKGWDAAYPRIATWALLRDRKSGQTLRILNTHFDHVGVIAKHQSAVLIASWLKLGAWAQLRTIVMGDFNSVPDSSAYHMLAASEAGALRDARLVSRTPPYGPPGTFNAFRIQSNEAAPIDHIFLSEGMQVDRYAVLTQHYGGRLPSDHYPVVVELTLDKP